MAARPERPRDSLGTGDHVEPGVPRLALTRAEAAVALGMSLDSFERYVQAEVRLVRRGRMRVVPVVELAGWLDRNAERAIEEGECD